MNKFVSAERIESVAKQTGFKRRTSIISPESFLNTLFFSNSQSCPTLSEYSIDLGYKISKSVSKQAIDKRIMDGSEFIVSKNLGDVFPGYGGTGREAIAQVQLEYELLGGKVTELSLGSALNSDSVAGMKNIDKVPSKALLIRDLGYFSPKAFKEITRHGIYFISRAKAQWSMYENQDGELKIITIQDIKDKLVEQKEKYLDIEVIIGEQARTPVRLIANLLTEEQTQKRIKKKKANRGPLSKQAEESTLLV
ncbi:MAG TPA: transposase [Cytophagales bacterium]|nr:transposase [Cytophagales bacterium]